MRRLPKGCSSWRRYLSPKSNLKGGNAVLFIEHTLPNDCYWLGVMYTREKRIHMSTISKESFSSLLRDIKDRKKR